MYGYEPARLAVAADLIHRLKQISEDERQAILTRTAGPLSPEEAVASTTALSAPRDWRQSLHRWNDVLKSAIIVLPDRSTAEEYGRIKAELAQIGKPIPDNDIWIAATARQYRLPLATRDAQFASIHGLATLKRYSEFPAAAVPALRWFSVL